VTLARGTVVLVELDPTVGHEQRGVRPCIAVSDPAVNADQRFPLIAVVPVTATSGVGALYPALSPGTSGLTKPSWALVDHLRPRLGGGGREGRHPVPVLPAEELVDGHAQRLAADIVERDVDRGDRGRQHPTALEVLAPIHFLPERAGTHRITADCELGVVLEGTDHRLLAARQPRLTPPVHPVVGLDLDQQLVPDPHPGWVRLDRRDPHAVASSRAARGRPDARSGWVSIIGQDAMATQASVRERGDHIRPMARRLTGGRSRRDSPTAIRVRSPQP